MAARLEFLPTEIIHNIFRFVLDSSPHTGRALSITNKCLSEAVSVIQARRKTVFIDVHRNVCQPLDLEPSAFENTHHLTIETTSRIHLPFAEPNTLVELLGRIKNLKTLTWNIGPIPAKIISALETLQPTCKLRIFKWWRFDEILNRLDESEIALSRFNNLTHLRYITVPTDPGRHPAAFYSRQVFQEIVSSSKGLELASFLMGGTTRHDGGTPWAGRMADANEEHEKIVDERARRAASLKSLTVNSPKFPISSESLLELNHFIDLAKLEYLKISRGRAAISYFQSAATLLPNLKHISLNFNGFNQTLLIAAKDYLMACSPCQTLSLWAWSSVIQLSKLLARHGDSLEVLQLHEKFVDPQPDAQKLMKLADVKLIEKFCPRLADVTIDLDVRLNTETSIRSLEMDAEVINALRSLVEKRPRLRRIQIYHHNHELLKILDEAGRTDLEFFDSEEEESEYEADIPLHDHLRTMHRFKRAEEKHIMTRKPHVLPLVESYTIELWKSLYGRAVAGEKLLDIKFGDWESRSVSIEHDDYAKLFCEIRPHERDDRKGECTLKTRFYSVYQPDGVQI